MITFAELNEPVKAGGGGGGEHGVNSQLWLACAGGMVQIPAVHSKVYYFPQGHAEHALGPVDFGVSSRIPALVLCRVASVKFMADSKTDEVFVRIRLIPVRSNELDYGEDDELGVGRIAADEQDKPASFAKTLTQSDANNGGGFSVPRYCAETIFPRLDYSADPPVQTVVVKDVHGASWKFRHIYRGTPRRHLLTTGWSTFVNQKKLVAGDSIVFLRADDGELHVGIRRAKRIFCGGDEPSVLPGWNQPSGNCVPAFGNLPVFLREEESKLMGSNGHARGRGRVQAEAVAEAASLAANGQPFEITYYPRATTPEFCVRAAAVTAAMRVHWCPGMRFKMAFETEDSSRISWFMGTISSVQVADPTGWPHSPWRLLQVTWDEPDLLQNVKRVSPWLLELVSSMPAIHLASSFSPPRKKPRLPPFPEFPFQGQLLNPVLHGNPLAHMNNHPPGPFPDSAPAAGIQGARHAQFGASFSDLHLSHLQSSLLLSGLRRLDHTACPPRTDANLTVGNPTARKDVSCSLSIGTPPSAKKSDNDKLPRLVLFGRTILTEQQMSLSNSGGVASPGATEKTANVSDGSGSAVIQNSPRDNTSRESLQWSRDGQMSEFGLEPGQCKVFMESDNVGRNLDLSVLGSFEELYRQLADSFCINKAELTNRVLYRDAKGEVRHAGDEPFSVFLKSARRLTILTDAGSDNLGS